MSLKAVLFDFNGVILNDEAIHKRLIEQLLLDQNLRPQPGEFEQFCLGRSDRACLVDLLGHRGRVLTESQLNSLIATKERAYLEYLQTLDPLPIFAGIAEEIAKLAHLGLKLAIVTGAARSEVKLALERGNLADFFATMIAAEDIQTSKPNPEGYLLAVEQLGQQFPDLDLTPANCLAIEDSFAGLRAAKQANIAVVGVANTYPFHMLHRRANWTVDALQDLEWDRIQEWFATR